MRYIKFKVGDKVIKADGSNWSCGMKYRKIVKVNELFGYCLERCLGYWEDEELELFKEEFEVEKTFTEVIADIKEGQVWENGAKIIEKTNNAIQVRKKNGKSFDSYFINFPNEAKYKLKRKECTFEEAFKAYKAGKVIESVVTGDKYTWNGLTDLICKKGSSEYNKLKSIYIEEIKGKWYIND